MLAPLAAIAAAASLALGAHAQLLVPDVVNEVPQECFVDAAAPVCSDKPVFMFDAIRSMCRLVAPAQPMTLDARCESYRGALPFFESIEQCRSTCLPARNVNDGNGRTHTDLSEGITCAQGPCAPGEICLDVKRSCFMSPCPQFTCYAPVPDMSAKRLGRIRLSKNRQSTGN